MDSAIDTVLLLLYRAARELPPHEFQQRAFALIKPLLGFQSGIWGEGTVLKPGLQVHRAHLYEVDPESLTVWKQINREDKVIPIASASPFMAHQFHAPTLFAAPEDKVMRDYARRFGSQSYLITCLPTSKPSRFAWMTLRRSDADSHYSEGERDCFETLMPHLEEAFQINQTFCEHKLLSEQFLQRDRALALIGANGEIQIAKAEFMALLKAEWTEADDQFIPPPLFAKIKAQQMALYLGKRIRFESQALGEYFLLKGRMRSRMDQLSPRQLEVAKLFAAGLDYKSIAKRTGLSPSTVRNHLAAAYQHLAISSRSELAEIAKGQGPS